MALFFADHILDAIRTTGATTLELASRRGESYRDFHVMHNGLSIGKIRVYECAIQLLNPGQWPSGIPVDDRGEVWQHYRPEKERIEYVERWITNIIDRAIHE